MNYTLTMYHTGSKLGLKFEESKNFKFEAACLVKFE